jgi:SAM-dependent methyltransferase
MSDGPVRDFEATYQAGAAPWEIGRPQGEIVRLAEAGLVIGTVLDVGCGTGENALHLAARGHAVLGVDGSATAIALARQKAAARGVAGVQFHVWDALQLRRLRKSFDTVIDSGLFHVFPDEQRRPYAEALAEVTASGSDLFILCWSDEEPPGPGPRRVAEHELRGAFRSIFAVMDVRPALFEKVVGGPARAWLARLTKI